MTWSAEKREGTQKQNIIICMSTLIQNQHCVIEYVFKGICVASSFSIYRSPNQIRSRCMFNSLGMHVLHKLYHKPTVKGIKVRGG